MKKRTSNEGQILISKPNGEPIWIYPYQERCLIDGKPYFGIICAITTVVNCINDPIDRSYWFNKMHRNSEFPNCERRQVVEVIRPPYLNNSIAQNGTLSIKFLRYGRACHVMRSLAKGKKRYKKAWIGGKRKSRRIKKGPHLDLFTSRPKAGP